MKTKGILGLTPELLVTLIIALVIIGIVLTLFLASKVGVSGMKAIGCGVCDKVVGNFVKFVTLGFINPCVNIFSCCDEKTLENCDAAQLAILGVNKMTR